MKFTDIKWLFFDLGSTVLDETKAYYYRVSECIEGSDITFEEFDQKRMEFAKDIVCGDVQAADYFGLKLKPWRSDVEYPYSDAETVLEKLKSMGYKIGVIANQPEGTKCRLDKFGILKYFDVVFASYEEGVSKPDKEIFLRALKYAGCPPESCVMLGDRLDNDILPAKELGFKTVWVKHGVVAPYQDIPSDIYQPDATVKTLTDLLNLF